MEAIKQASPVPISFENIETGAKGSYIRLHCLRTCVAKRKNLVPGRRYTDDLPDCRPIWNR